MIFGSGLLFDKVYKVVGKENLGELIIRHRLHTDSIKTIIADHVLDFCLVHGRDGPDDAVGLAVLGKGWERYCLAVGVGSAVGAPPLGRRVGPVPVQVLRVELPDSLGHLDAVHLRHVDVSEDQPVVLGATKFVQFVQAFLHHFEGLRAGEGAVALELEAVLDHELNGLYVEGVVIHDQDLATALRHDLLRGLGREEILSSNIEVSLLL